MGQQGATQPQLVVFSAITEGRSLPLSHTQPTYNPLQVGPSGGGKSAIMEALAGALTEMGTKHVIWRMNPKAITAPQVRGGRGAGGSLPQPALYDKAAAWLVL